MIHEMIISDSKARISGSRERHVQSGSRLTLSCRIEEYTGPPTYVFWYRNSEVINYSERKSILISSGRSNHLPKPNGNKFKNTFTTATVESSRISNSPTSTSMLSNENDSISKNYRKVFNIIAVNFDPNQYIHLLRFDTHEMILEIFFKRYKIMMLSKAYQIRKS